MTELNRCRTLAILAITVAWLIPESPQNTVMAAQPPVLSIGAKAPHFDLPGTDDRNHSLNEFESSTILVVVFTCNHCPTAQAYEDRLVELSNRYNKQDVAVVAISPNDPLAVRLDELGYTDVGDSLEDMKIRAKDKKFPFPYLYDGENQKVSRAYGVAATPHLFVFDQQRTLRYVGRYDDAEKGKVKSQDAINAIEAILANKEVPVKQTRVFGCSTKWSNKRQSARESVEKWDREDVGLKTIDAAGVKELSSNKTKNYRLINVWATWCAPCVIELPEFVTINRMYRRRNFELITISMNSLDTKDQSLKVLKDRHVACSNYIFDSTDRDALAEALDPKWLGPVPYTVLIAPGGEVVYRNPGSINPLKLKQAIVEKLGRTY